MTCSATITHPPSTEDERRTRLALYRLILTWAADDIASQSVRGRSGSAVESETPTKRGSRQACLLGQPSEVLDG